MTFYLAGKLSKPKAELEWDIVTKGHTLAPSISKKVDYFVTNDLDSDSAGVLKAKELELNIINEEEFWRILNG